MMSTHTNNDLMMKKNWEHLVDVAPRFMGTAGEAAAVNHIMNEIQASGKNPIVQSFTYDGWEIKGPVQLTAKLPELLELDASVLLGSGTTGEGIVEGKLILLGETIIWDMYEWIRFGIVNDQSELVGYISGRPNGKAISQTLAEGNSMLPHFTIGEEDAQLFVNKIKQHQDVFIQGKVNTRRTGVQAGQNIRVQFTGEQRTDKLIICAHYDTMFNTPGAYDNASGVAVLLQLVRNLQAYSILKDVELVFMGAEEWNLAGSKAYVEQLVLSGQEEIGYVINIDGLGRSNVLEAWTGPENVEHELFEFFNQSYKRDIYIKTPPPPGSDHTPFYNIGIPVCMFTINDQEIIHSANDTPHISIFDNMKEFVHIITEFLKYKDVIR